MILKNRKSKTTGEIEIDPEKLRIVVQSLNSKMAFISLSSVWKREEWPNDPRFLDLREKISRFSKLVVTVSVISSLRKKIPLEMRKRPKTATRLRNGLLKHGLG